MSKELVVKKRWGWLRKTINVVGTGVVVAVDKTRTESVFIGRAIKAGVEDFKESKDKVLERGQRDRS